MGLNISNQTKKIKHKQCNLEAMQKRAQMLSIVISNPEVLGSSSPLWKTHHHLNYISPSLFTLHSRKQSLWPKVGFTISDCIISSKTCTHKIRASWGNYCCQLRLLLNNWWSSRSQEKPAGGSHKMYPSLFYFHLSPSLHSSQLSKQKAARCYS